VLIAECLLLDVYFLEPVLIVELSICLLLQPDLRVHAAEVDGAPHFVGVELVRAPVFVAVSNARVVNAREQGVTGLEAELAVEDITVSVAHQVESVVAYVHISLII